MVAMALGQVMRPRLAPVDDVLPYLRRMESAGRFANGGPLARELEQRHAARLGVHPTQVVAVTSGTSGLIGAMALSPARQWAVPAFTFAATGHAVVASGGSMEIHDVDPVTWMVRLPAAGPGMVIVLPFGVGLQRGAWPREREVVVDAAASLGAADMDLRDLPDTWSVVFSLNATKVMPCGEGGLVVCGDPERAEGIRQWAHFGLDEHRSAVVAGINALMPELSAACGLAALDGWERERDEWRAAHALSARVTAQLGLVGPPRDGGDVHPYWVVRFPDATTCTLVESGLAAAAIATRRWWGPGLHRMPAFADYSSGPCPVTDELAATTLGLPFWRGLAADDADDIGQAIRSVLDKLPTEE